MDATDKNMSTNVTSSAIEDEALESIETRKLLGDCEHATYEVQRNFEGDAKPVDVSIESSAELMTNNRCLMNLIKACIGTGILAMPQAVQHGGLWLGTGALILLALITTNCMHMLVYCTEKQCQRLRVRNLDYADSFAAAFSTGPAKMRKFTKTARNTVNFFLIVTQFGFCVVYIVFIARTTEKVVNNFSPNSVSIQIYNLGTTALVIPFTFVKTYDKIAPFSTLANVLNVIGLVILLQYIVQGLPHTSTRAAVGPLSEFPLFLGTVTFAFEGIGVVLPLQNKMKHKEDFGGWVGVINMGMVVVSALYVAVGFYGYLQYGDDIDSSITLNLPSTEWLYLIVQLMFAVTIYVSFGVQFYVPVEIIWPAIAARIQSPRKKICFEYLFRTLMVLVTYGLAAVVPHIGLLISLIGAFAGSCLAMIFPAIIEILTFSIEGETLGFFTIIKCVIYFIIGLAGFGTGTYASLNSIIDTFTNSNSTNN